jgi:hypothetical protein
MFKNITRPLGSTPSIVCVFWSPAIYVCFRMLETWLCVRQTSVLYLTYWYYCSTRPPPPRITKIHPGRTVRFFQVNGGWNFRLFTVRWMVIILTIIISTVVTYLLPKIHITDFFFRNWQSYHNKIHDKHTLGSVVRSSVVRWVIPLTQSVGSSVGVPETNGP